ncbi:MAG: hypothetical protein EON88_21440 [Brevundimonas sp.]|nr:MAG: hypothetical protein EON88_21440 [Brevundimonas sp.]
MSRAFAVVAPMFRPRRDGVQAVVFPAPVLARLWRRAAAREAGMLAALDLRDERDRAHVDLVCGRLLTAAAAVARDEADLIWPAGPALGADRDEDLAELARCCDLAPMIHRRLDNLPSWTGRPDEEALAQLRLLVRDCADLSPDGVRRLLDILIAHMDGAAQILRVVVHAFQAAQRDAVLAQSDLAVFAERLLTAAEARVDRNRRFSSQAPDLAEALVLRDDLAWVGDTLAEMERTLALSVDGEWAGRVRAARRALGQVLGDRLVDAPRAVERVLPTVRVQTAGRMTRVAPSLETVVTPDAWRGAEAAIEVLRGSRGPATAFGCEAKRRQISEALIQRLAEYADQALDAVNGGETPDEWGALDRIEVLASLLVRLDAAEEARTVRRRAAVAGVMGRGDAASRPAA